jgi:hypothetical protein
MPKICFVALGALPLLNGEKSSNFIGPDIHQFILANELSKHNFQVKIIVYGKEDLCRKNLKAIAIGEYTSNKNIINLFAKIIKIYISLRKSNSDIFFVCV